MDSILCPRPDDPVLHKAQSPCHISKGGPCTACIKIKEVESQISVARGSLKKLFERHRELRTEMNRIHNPIILQAPPEIASTIFQFCIPSWTVSWDGHILPLTFKKDVAARLALGAVCREWRYIAWSTPRLWDALAIRLNSQLAWEPDFIRDWLDRSGGLPLAIFVYKPFDASESDPYTNAMALIDVLNQQSSRWQILELERIPAAFFSSFYGDSSSISNLRSLVIKANYKDSRNGQFALRNAIPRPDKVILDGPCFKSVDIVWDKVTSVHLRGLRVHEYWELLTEAPKLQKLTLAILSAEENIPSVPTNGIFHLQLEELCIDYYNITDLETFLAGVVFPGLTNLIIHDDDETLPFPMFLSLFQRSACRLRELDISGTLYGSSDIVGFLEHIPSLERLKLSPPSESDHLPDELFKRLAKTSILPDGEIDGKTPLFLPHLRSFGYDANQKYCERANRKFPWHLLPPIFGPLPELGNPRRRLLNSVQILFDATEDDECVIIDAECIPSLLSILKAGLELEVHYTLGDLNLKDTVYNLGG